MRRPPTDFAILKEIFKRYRKTFEEYVTDDEGRSSKIYVPIDIEAMAEGFGVDKESIFGRLYYHLNEEYGHGESQKLLFTMIAPDKAWEVNFPLAEAVLAKLWEERRKYVQMIVINVVSAIITAVSLTFAIVTALNS